MTKVRLRAIGGEEMGYTVFHGGHRQIVRYFEDVMLTGRGAGSGNNRADRRDDGLRQDRHANRNRGQRGLLPCESVSAG